MIHMCIYMYIHTCMHIYLVSHKSLSGFSFSFQCLFRKRCVPRFVHVYLCFCNVCFPHAQQRFFMIPSVSFTFILVVSAINCSHFLHHMVSCPALDGFLDYLLEPITYSGRIIFESKTHNTIMPGLLATYSACLTCFVL